MGFMKPKSDYEFNWFWFEAVCDTYFMFSIAKTRGGMSGSPVLQLQKNGDYQIIAVHILDAVDLVSIPNEDI